MRLPRSCAKRRSARARSRSRGARRSGQPSIEGRRWRCRAACCVSSCARRPGDARWNDRKPWFARGSMRCSDRASSARSRSFER